MRKLAPLTKLILTVMVSLWALLIPDLAGLAILAAGLVLAAAASGILGKTYKALLGLTFFAALLAAMQYAFGADLAFSLSVGLRMIAMTGVFILLLASTRIQDITTALVNQCKVPYEYAFMFTAALRFIPDFLAESKAVREAQACRGYAPQGNVLRRLYSYLTVVQPLVLRAVTRSETMAMSLELRGFGHRRTSGFIEAVALAGRDYAALAAMAAVTAGLAAVRLIA